MSFEAVLLVGYGLLDIGFIGYDLAARYACRVEERIKARMEDDA